MPRFEDFPWLLTMGITSMTAHYAMARALLLADAMAVAPMDFLRVPLIAVVGAWIYLEPLEIWTLVGALIILFGNLGLLRNEARS